MARVQLDNCRVSEHLQKARGVVEHGDADFSMVGSMPFDILASAYARNIAFAESSGVAAEPEAQLTVPVHDLFTGVAAEAGLGDLTLVREAQLRGVRPDFAAFLDGRPCGWVELKAPGRSVYGDTWRGREQRQWELLSELDALIVSNGEQAVLYAFGEQVMEADLPFEGSQGWDSGPLVDLLRLFTSSRPATVRRVSELSARLAPLARLLRERIETGLQSATLRPPVEQAWHAWQADVHEGATKEVFANDLAQVIAYSLAIAALRGEADANADGYISLAEAQDTLRGPNDVLAAALGPALQVRGLLDELNAEIGAIERLASVVDPVRIGRSRDSRGEPWLWFYEDFLAKYDPQARKEAGVYYTPTDVVQAQVRLVDHILKNTFEKPLSFGDSSVTTLDPATGSGTYPLAVIDHAGEVAEQHRGPAGPQQVATSLARNLIAFEVLPGPYAVAHLRIGQRLAELAGTLIPPEHVRVYLTDTLDDPESEEPALGLWGDQAVLAEERLRASKVKKTEPVTVIIGNPPYARRTAASGGGWVVHPNGGRSLFDDVIEPAQQQNVIFSAQASLYNDYVYFWRWALWKAFEQYESQPAVISFITASSWLDGPAFVGLRALAREHADEMWILDLGGEGRGAVQEENVFAIQTPVSIVTLYRNGPPRTEPARVYYRRITGSTSEKLATLQTVQAPIEEPDQWKLLDLPTNAALIPDTGSQEWQLMPRLADLLPWQQPGSKLDRAWPISPSPTVLKERWQTLLSRTAAEERAEYFVTRKAGRNIHTQVRDLQKLSELPASAAHEAITRYGYRSFDRQWTFQDPRLAKTESPSLWASRSEKQIFLSSFMTNPLGDGPGITVTTAVPDLHHFRGSYGGKDVLPLYRDADGLYPNLPNGLLQFLTETYDRTPAVTPEDVAAYIYALLAHPGYVERFREELNTPGPRVPFTASPDFFERAVTIGKRLLWLHTYGERFTNTAPSTTDTTEELRPPHIPRIASLAWRSAVTRIPQDTSEITYDSSTRSLHIGDGVITGVPEDVWEFEVSGFPVVQRWLGSRTANGIGRSAISSRYATPLDHLRPTQWEDPWNDELLDLLTVLSLTIETFPLQATLLEEVTEGELIPSSSFPSPTDSEQAPPRT